MVSRNYKNKQLADINYQGSESVYQQRSYNSEQMKKKKPKWAMSVFKVFNIRSYQESAS